MPRPSGAGEGEGPRLEKQKHLDAERRLKASVISGTDYEGKAEDVALIKRKARELGDERLRRAVDEAGA
jgi:hypothetical protein